MTRRLPVAASPGPLEGYATCFDDLFRARAQRNKTLTALANTEPVAGAQRKEAQSLQWFLSESGWDPQETNERRLELLFAEATTVPKEDGVLVIDEHGDRKWGKHTAHVGKQWLGNMGKTENGVVSVSSLWADEGVYYPLAVEPYTPKHHFEGGTSDPRFRTKLDSLPAGGTLGRDWRALQGGGCGLLLRRRRGFQAGFERPWGGIRAGLEGVSLLVAQRRDDRGFVGSRLGSRMEERRGCGAVDGGGAYLPRRAPREVVGAGGSGRTLRHPASTKSTRGHHRSRKVAPPGYVVSDHQPARTQRSLRAGNQQRFGPRERGGGGEALRS